VYNNELYQTDLVFNERTYYPDSTTQTNLPVDFYRGWVLKDTEFNNLISAYDVIIIKHDAQASRISADTGNPDPSSSYQSIENYKAIYRALRDKFDANRNKVFIIWTLPPLSYRFSLLEASRAKEFSNWLNFEFLSENGSHPNIFIWDYRGLVQNSDGFLADGSGNVPSTETIDRIAPLFGQFIFDKTKEYFSKYSPQEPPSAPASLTATALSDTQIKLIWTDNSNNEEGFKIERKVGETGSFIQVLTTGQSFNTATDSSGLAPLTKYYYRVKAYNKYGESDYSSEASATTLSPYPSAPTELTATPVSYTQIDLSWKDNSFNESGFKIERKTATGTYTQIATVSANINSYQDKSGLSEGTTYYYRVKAYRTSYPDSDYSNEASARTLSHKPNAPSNLVATVVSAFTIKLTWQDNSNDEYGFKIWYKEGANGTYSYKTLSSANQTSYSFDGLKPETTYYFKITAYNYYGDSLDYSNEASATTLSAKPQAPSNLSAVFKSSTSVILTWQDNSSDETGFAIYRKDGINGSYTEIKTVSSNATTYTASLPNSCVDYYFLVRAYNSYGESTDSNEVKADYKMITPSKLTAQAVSSSQINLSWADPYDNESRFEIEYKIGDNGTWLSLTQCSANTTSYSHRYLQSKTTYYYRVRAYLGCSSYYCNTYCYSDYSNEAKATTP